MIQGRDIWKNWSWQHFITLGSQKGLGVINPCWESNLDSLSFCVQVCVHSARLQLLLWVTVLCELCYNLQKMTKVHDACLWRLWMIFYWCEYKRTLSIVQVWLLLLYFKSFTIQCGQSIKKYIRLALYEGHPRFLLSTMLVKSWYCELMFVPYMFTWGPIISPLKKTSRKP